MIVTVDALQPGTGGNDYVAQLAGGSPSTTGWQTFNVSLGTLSAGIHTLTIGGYNNKKTTSSESTQVFIDNVLVESSGYTVDGPPVLDEDFFPPANIPLHDGINSLVQGAGGSTNIVLGLDGGGDQFATGLGDRPGVPNLMIFITDGNDTNGNSITDIENASANSGAEVFAVGVGSGVSAATIDAIASDPDGDHVFTSEFSELLDLIDAIVAAALESAKQVFTVEGGAGAGASVSGGTLYDIDSQSGDGRVVRSRVLHMPDDTIVVKSVQTD
ncbi:MAG: VWA domain-containing protein [Dehalococcoidia bacterium]